MYKNKQINKKINKKYKFPREVAKNFWQKYNLVTKLVRKLVNE